MAIFSSTDGRQNIRQFAGRTYPSLCEFDMIDSLPGPLNVPSYRLLYSRGTEFENNVQNWPVKFFAGKIFTIFDETRTKTERVKKFPVHNEGFYCQNTYITKSKFFID